MTVVEQLMAAGGVILLVLALRLAGKPAAQRRFWPVPARVQEIGLEPVDQLRLTAQHSIHVFRFADKVFVIATHGGGCVLLEQRAWPIGTEPGKGASA